MQENTSAVQEYKTQLAKVNDLFMPMIISQLQDHGITMSSYQRTVTLNAMTAMSTLLNDNNLTINDIDSSNVTNILLTIAALELNASANPREVYFILRNKKDKRSKIIEMGIEGDGNDALLARFGRDVKHVYPFWAVREGDGFEYPKHKGIQSEPPSWTESGKGKVVRVVYPIEYTNGSVDYKIGEREDVKKNLIAHVNQNLMWDKSGAKEKFMAKASEMKLDEILDDPEMISLGKVSPAWSSLQSRESMILRKMRNNVVKKIPKNFANDLMGMEYDAITNESYKEMRKDVTENANTISFDDMPMTNEVPESSQSSATLIEESHETQVKQDISEEAPTPPEASGESEDDPF